MDQGFPDLDGLGSGVLQDIATPGLYRTNAFRVLGLSVTVTATEMSKHQKRMKMMEKLGVNNVQSHTGIFPLDPPPDEDAIRKAGQRLHDLQARMVDELFWFWPMERSSHADDEALSLLQHGDITGAHRIWSDTGESDQRRSVSVHNLAVLRHALALDLEVGAGSSGNVSPKSAARRDQHWRAALRHWAAAAEDEAFWARVASRARDLDDPRLTVDFVQRLRRSLPTALLSISTSLAARAAKHGDTEEARRHLGYINDSGFNRVLARGILEREASSLADQVERISAPFAGRSESDPGHADKLAQQVLDDCSPILAGMQAILTKDNHIHQKACNRVAGAVRACMIAYSNETQDLNHCLVLLQEAASRDEGLQAQLQDDINQVSMNLSEKRRFEDLRRAVAADRVYEVTSSTGQVRSANACTCCLGPATEEQTVSRTWEETRGITRYRRSLSFAFPICSACRRHQSEYVWKRLLLILASAGVSSGLVYVVAQQIQEHEWFYFVLAGSLATVAVTILLSSMVRLSVLSDEHACRDRAVEMSAASESYVVFRFHNPLYAQALARSNDLTVRELPMTKPPRGSNILGGRGRIPSVTVAVILAAVAHSFIYAGMEGNWKGQPARPTMTVPRVSYPAQSWPQRPVPTYSDSGLDTHIDAGKARARVLEAGVRLMSSDLEMLSGKLQSSEQEISGYESRIKQGMDVNESLYEQAVDAHNRMVTQYNALLADYKQKCAEYTREVNSVNDMVRRYNSGER